MDADGKVTIHALKCQTCGFWLSALTEERVKVCALEHLIAVHSTVKDETEA